MAGWKGRVRVRVGGGRLERREEAEGQSEPFPPSLSELIGK